MKNLGNPTFRLVFFMFCTIIGLQSCNWEGPSSQASIISIPDKKTVEKEAFRSATEKTATEKVSLPVADPVVIASSDKIFARPQIPILCYHQVRDYRATDSRSSKDYIVPPSVFEAQMKALAANGYTSILPEQLYKYLATGESLPQNPVLITFDDGCDEQFDVTHAVLDPLHFKASFFIMTVSVNRPNYMKAEQIRQLSDEGHSIGLHTWDHHNVKKYQGTDWEKQIEKPKVQLEKIIGKPVQFFAYPFGLWNESVIPELKNRGLKAAFQLSVARDQAEPLYTIRRIIVTGDLNGPQLIKHMNACFK
ncbi:polysaccharide deacetylase family protein [Flavihumibacter profundi]|uniref:polysaccharide deacetylase family protein n=1 Tax=Flavihumibacter profundi TaxID=2716883 RepID=UPI001CC51DA8|nr:polysaccharide deacetylase family protein [Flavihumibacter profundi]MBZ5856502.1 polysaccharide deacetylase family protein [Flavihumibacter profundi]